MNSDWRKKLKAMASTFYEHPIIITMTEKLIFRSGVRIERERKRENGIISPLDEKEELLFSDEENV